MAVSKIPISFDNTGDVSVTVFRGESKYYKKNGVVYMWFNGSVDGTVPSGQWTLLGTLPVKYRPSATIIGTVCFGGYANIPGIVRVETTGNVSAFQNSENSLSDIWGGVFSFVAST